MAYFDSAKNRALWQEELSRLTREREKRERGEVPGLRGKVSKTAGNPLVQRITFAELLREEERALGKEKAKRTGTLRKDPGRLAASVPSERRRKSL